MVPQDEVDRDLLAAAKNQGPAAEERDGDEQEPDLDGAGGSEHSLYCLESLFHLAQADELPTLNPPLVFHKVVVNRSAVPINKQRFEVRFRDFIAAEKSDMPPPTPELVGLLYKRAVEAWRHITAWDAISSKTNRTELAKAHAFLQQELNRYAKIRAMLEKYQRAPSWMQPWWQCWVAAFHELQEQIETQLRSAIGSVAELRKDRLSARSEVESHILWLVKQDLSKQDAVARNLEIILAAFAYAAQLVAPARSGTVGYAALIKQRVSRVSRSEKRRKEAYSVVVSALLALQPGKPDSEPSS